MSKKPKRTKPPREPVKPKMTMEKLSNLLKNVKSPNKTNSDK